MPRLKLPPKARLIHPGQRNKRKTEATVVKIRLAVIDPLTKTITLERMPMAPAIIHDVTGKHGLAWGKIATVQKVECYLAGDRLPQVAIMGNVEHEYVLKDEFGQKGPVCHGRGLVFGFMPTLKKACSIPVTLEWLNERIIWGNGEDGGDQVEEEQGAVGTEGPREEGAAEIL